MKTTLLALMPRLTLGALALVFVSLAQPACPNAAEPQIPDDSNFSCPNIGPCPECPPPPPPPPDGGAGHGSGDSGGDDGCGDSAGGEGPGAGGGDDGSSKFASGCATPPCNSPLRTSRYGSPGSHLFAGTYRSGHFEMAKMGGEGHAGKRIVMLSRQDFFLTGNRGVPLQVARTYNNNTWSFASNDLGLTELGPKWHFYYRIQIAGPADSSTDKHVRFGDGAQQVLYYIEPGHWASNPAQGEGYDLLKVTGGWKLTTPDPAVWYEFNNWGRVTRMRYPNANTLDFAYDSSTPAKLIRVDYGHETNDIDPRYLTFQYTAITYGGNTRTRLHKVYFHRNGTADPELVSEYQYDANGMLWRVKDRFGSVVEEYLYTYIWDSYVITETRVRDASGELVTQRKYEYGWERQLTAVRDGASGLIYGEFSNSGAYYDPIIYIAGGSAMLYKTNMARDPVILQEWHPDGYKLRDMRQEFVYDSEWMSDAKMVKRTYDLDRGSTITYEYLSESSTGPAAERQRLKSVTYPDNSVVEYEYDSYGRITKVKRPLGRNSEYAYDAQGNVVYVKDHAGFESYYQYDTWGNLVREDLPTSLTRQFAYQAHGSVAVTTDTEGRVSAYERDSRDRVTTTTVAGIVTSYTYDSQDRAVAVTNQLGQTASVTYDGRDRIVATTSPLGLVRQFDYDTTGRLARIVDEMGTSMTMTYDFWGKLTEVRDELGRKAHEYEYDYKKRVVKKTNPLGAHMRYFYDESRASCSSCSGHDRNASGLLVAAKGYDDHVTSFTYDQNGKLVRQDFVGTSDYLEFTRDTAGRVVAVTDTRLSGEDVGGDTFEYEYDSNDRLTTTTYPDGSAVAIYHDALGRRTRLVDPDGNETVYTYGGQNVVAKLGSIQHNLIGDVTYYYHAGNKRMLGENLEFAELSTTYQYDTAGRLSTLTCTDMVTADIEIAEAFAYDGDNRVTTTTDWGLAIVPSGEELVRTVNAYDARSRLIRENRFYGTGVRLSGNHYEYDAASNRTTRQRFDGSTTATTTHSHTGWNQILYVNGDVREYDANGCVYHDRGTDRYYNHDRYGRLVSVGEEEPGAWEVRYVYDFLGRPLLREEIGGRKERYYYDGGLTRVLVKEKPVSGSWRTKQVYLLHPGSVAHVLGEREVTSWTEGGEPSAWTDRGYVYDRAGNVSGYKTGSTGEFVRVAADAFGNPLLGGHGPGPRLTTKFYEPAWGLYWFGARWYEPETGTWLEPAAVSVLDEETYAFCFQQPGNYFDPDGAFPVAVDPSVFAMSKGGKQNIRPSDFPPKNKGESDRDWGERAGKEEPEKAKSKWRGFIKHLKRGGGVVGKVGGACLAFVLLENKAHAPGSDDLIWDPADSAPSPPAADEDNGGECE